MSESFAHVMRGIDWQPGDEIVTSADEEGALLVPMLQVAGEKGVRVRRLALPLDGDGTRILDEASGLLGPATRLLAFSHVTTDLGVRLPAAELCALAEQRGVPSFVDVAHAAGAMPVDLHTIGCWYAGAVSYKWMMAPYAAGALFVRRDHLADLPVIYAGGRSDATLDRGSETMTLHEGAGRFEFGPWAWPLVHAWAAALDYLESLGLPAIFDRCARLASRLKEGLAALPRVRVLTPLEPERSANLIAFDVEGWTGTSLEHHLRREHDIVVRALMDEPDGVRASVAFFTLESEVDALIAAIAALPPSSSPTSQ